MEFVEWFFLIIAFVCALFFVQMAIDFQREKSELMPQVKQVLEIRARHESEIEKVERLISEAEAQLATLDEEFERVNQETTSLEAKIEAIGKTQKADT